MCLFPCAPLLISTIALLFPLNKLLFIKNNIKNLIRIKIFALLAYNTLRFVLG